MSLAMISSYTLPRSQRAVVQGEKGEPILASDVPLPPLLEATVLVKTAGFALNTYDYKIGSLQTYPGAIIVNDFVGAIVKIANDTTTELRVGDVVLGTVHGSNPSDAHSGAFAEYVRAPADLLLRVPEGLAIEEAATFGLALTTSVLRAPVLVYGASTSTGAMALQLLRLAGFSPIATCSPRNFDLVRTRGAAAVFDYAAPGTAEQVRLHTGDRLCHTVDCIGDRESVAFCQAAIGRTGGRVARLEVCPGALRTRRAVKVELVMALEVFGKEVALPEPYYRAANQEKHDAEAHFFTVFQRLLDDGKLKPHPVQLVPGGWIGVLDGLHRLRSGAISGKKLVVLL
ncbi:Uu.00g117340.m01.CDS01 [Anthostomella pinea]|uniref:Uu.00g117340.m01.CDS01 n=1 Tax=Anthostomella pinea TaxID=933095 RepID=A0AAI8VG82_9PEZI|nr:Uu.00g117340.m01.CDS01 [Anthostomella pinea]